MFSLSLSVGYSFSYFIICGAHQKEHHKSANKKKQVKSEKKKTKNKTKSQKKMRIDIITKYSVGWKYGDTLDEEIKKCGMFWEQH